ncbi:hypothetical protein [Fundidesulfovibrio agrisoli]|uniref:hypothetical protein n=1 Tax=Fundidesulfovibrio agrisoli TaxID=2922717 RepID=UPI001FAC52B6|nr:hypothetical protein [Fundidesulfovibrio agrisoli]
MNRVLRYQTPEGLEPVTLWIEGLPDPGTRKALKRRVEAVGLIAPSPGQAGPVREAVLDFGPGVRLYYAPVAEGLLLLLCGTDPRALPMERDTASRFLEEYLSRTALAA